MGADNTTQHNTNTRVPSFDNPKVDLKPGVVEFPKRETPGFKSTLG